MTKLLIVDDNEQNLYMLQVLLEGHGYEVESAGDGAEALEKARRDPPDIIISDILMPVMDGFTLCREWKKDEVLKAIPFVFYTATYTDPKDEEFALSLGAERFIVKPVEPGVFVEMLREVIGEAEEGRLVAPREPIEEEPVYLKEYSERLVKKLEDKMLQLEWANRRLTVLYQASTGLASVKLLGELVPYALRTVVEAMGFANGSYFVYDEEKQELRLLEAVGFSDEVLATFRRELVFSLGEARGLVGLVGQTQEPLIVADTTRDPRWITLDETIRSALFVPVVHEGRLLGVANFLSTEAGVFDAADARNMMTLANNVAIAIENARLYEQAQQEIAERKRGEEELRRLKEFNEGIVQGMVEGIAVEDAEGYFTFVNPAAAAMLGYAPEELLGRHWTVIIPPDQQPIVQAADERRARGESDQYELRLIHKDGTRVPVLISGSPRFEEGRFAGTLAVFTDVTERVRAEGELQERERFLSSIFASIQDGLSILDKDMHIIRVNPAMERWYSHAMPLVGKKCYQAYHGRSERCEVCPSHQTLETGESAYEVVPKRGPAGEVVGWLDLYSFPLIDTATGQLKGVIEYVRDVTERKRAQEELRQSYVTLQRVLEGTVNTLVSAIEMRDPYTAGHQRRVTQLACAIAKEMGTFVLGEVQGTCPGRQVQGLPKDQIEGLRMAGLIHDIGKISIPAEILSKPSRLNDLEWGIIKAHSQIGYDILKTVEFPGLVAEIVLQHHERMDGSGYPQGLSGEEIMLEARILAVADVIEAMASHRPYRPARGLDKALEEISQNKGVLYDSQVVDACLKLFTEKGFTFG